MPPQTSPQTVHQRSPRPLLRSRRGYMDTGVHLQGTSEAVVPVPEVELEFDQTVPVLKSRRNKCYV